MRSKNLMKKKKKKPNSERGKQNVVAQIFLIKTPMTFVFPFFLLISPKFGENVFWWAWRENTWAPPDFPSLFSPNQTTQKVIFFHIFFSSISILF